MSRNEAGDQITYSGDQVVPAPLDEKKNAAYNSYDVIDEKNLVGVDGGETKLNMHTIMKGSAQKPPTMFEHKAALINAEIDKMGVGRYQLAIWFLTGFGYFVDLAWSQGVGLAASAIYQEMGVVGNTGLIFTCANVGLALGALFWGMTVDVIGRKWAFNLTLLITSVFGTLLAAPRFNYPAICGIYFLASFGLGGNIPIDALIALEFLPQNRRFLVPLLSMWQPIGVVAASGFAYGTAAKYRCEVGLPYCRDPDLEEGAACCTVASNMGWRYLVIALGGVTLVMFCLRFFVFKFHESPKFLLSQGKEQEAIDVLVRITKFNRQPPPTLTVEHFQEVEAAYLALHPTDPSVEAPRNQATYSHVTKRALSSLKNIKGIFATKLQSFIFVLLAIAYMGDYWSFNLAGAFLPIILLRNNVDNGRGTVQDTYAQYVYIKLPGVIGAVLGLLAVDLPLVGRKWSLVFSAILQGMAMAMYTQVNTTAGYVGLNAFAYVMQTLFNAILYASAPELFDTSFRGSASGMLSCLGRVAGIVAPIAGQSLLEGKSMGILWLGAGGIWVAALVMVFLPVEMRGRQMY